MTLINTDIPQNPLKGVFEWERKSKLRLRTRKVEFSPTICSDEEEVDHPGYLVTVGNQAAGEVFFDAEKERWYHLEPAKRDEDDDDEDPELERKGAKKNFEDIVTSLLKVRFPKEFEGALL